jgi:polyferredoxin
MPLSMLYDSVCNSTTWVSRSFHLCYIHSCKYGVSEKDICMLCGSCILVCSYTAKETEELFQQAHFLEYFMIFNKF